LAIQIYESASHYEPTHALCAYLVLLYAQSALQQNIFNIV